MSAAAFGPDPVGLTQALIRIDTRNPPGEEHRAVPLLQRRLTELGATCRTFEPHPGRSSLIAEVGDPGAPVLALCGHLDTVGFDHDDWRQDPLGGVITGDRLYGRGSTDMKGGIAALVEALAAVRSRGTRPAWLLRFLLLADEEDGSGVGAALLPADVLTADLGIVTEPTALRATTSERGAAWLRFDVRGVSAHASQPESGRSAISAAAELVTRLDTARAANVGRIEGGTEPNIIAESCRLRVDRRLRVGESRDDVLEWAYGHADAVSLARDVAIEVALEDLCLASASDPAEPRVTAAIAALDPDGDGPRQFGATTDARFLRAAGTPTIVWGPGDLRRAHTVDEWVSVAELETATARLTELYLGSR
ncbi:M20 family metallopeptidase [Nonomuraea sp. NPDC002799]